MTRKIYSDMDGVIADFFPELARKNDVRHWKDIKRIDLALMRLWNTGFFFGLNEFGTSKELIETLKDIEHRFDGWSWGICSSPIRGDEYNSAYWKRRWLEERKYMPYRLENLIFTHSKEDYAINRIDGSSNVLIDDKPDNIRKWEKRGGVGFLYQANKDSLVDLQNELIDYIQGEKDREYLDDNI